MNTFTVATQQDMHQPVLADREIGDPAGRRGQGAPGAFDAVKPVAERDAQFRFHPDPVAVSRAAGCLFVAPLTPTGRFPTPFDPFR